MVKLSGFADEISQDLNVQLDTLQALGIKYFEFRGVWGKNVLALDKDELDKVKAEIDQRDIRVSALGSPIGKAPIDTDFDAYKELVQHAIDVASHMETPYIRMFSFYCNSFRFGYGYLALLMIVISY